MIIREAAEILKRWTKEKNRKPLLIRGARQVGKTTLVRHFSKEFNYFIELNLELEVNRNLFKLGSAGKVLDALALQSGIPIPEGETLLFIDEIQEAPEAIKMLRYFYEQHPKLHVIGAGSLLEFSLKKVPSFPVGRVSYLYLHPLNFREYLSAKGNQMALTALNDIPVKDTAHETLLAMFHTFLLIGGMPEIVNSYLESNDFGILSQKYNHLWTSFKDDIEKYALNQSQRNVIRHVLDTAASEKDRIVMAQFGGSHYKSREVGEALLALEYARVIRRIYPTTETHPPAVNNYRKSPRLQFVDTGFINHLLKLQFDIIQLKDLSDFYRGKIIAHLVTQELISIHHETDYRPNFWVREKKDSQAEVDLVYHYGKYLIPIEIKSGPQGKLKSLHQFLENAPHAYAVRCYAGPYSIEHHITTGGKPYLLMNLPYYLGTMIPQYIADMIKKYPMDKSN